jgi:hypothetical protein
MVIAVLVIELLLFRKQHSLTVAITGTHCTRTALKGACWDRGGGGTQGASHLETSKLVTTSLAMHCVLGAVVVVWVCLLSRLPCNSAGHTRSCARFNMFGHGVHSLPCACHHFVNRGAILLYQQKQTETIQKMEKLNHEVRGEIHPSRKDTAQQLLPLPPCRYHTSGVVLCHCLRHCAGCCGNKQAIFRPAATRLPGPLPTRRARQQQQG